jgi:hypothetical protein
MMTPILTTLDRVGYEVRQYPGRRGVRRSCAARNPTGASRCSAALPRPATRGQAVHVRLFPATWSRSTPRAGKPRRQGAHGRRAQRQPQRPIVGPLGARGGNAREHDDHLHAEPGAHRCVLRRARGAARVGTDFISIKDPTGLLTPGVGGPSFQRSSRPPARFRPASLALPVGLAPESINRSKNSPATAAEPSRMAHLPATEDIDARARRSASSLESTTRCCPVSGYFSWLAEREGKPRGQIANTISPLRAPGAGRMISNHTAAANVGIEDRLPAILEEPRSAPRLSDRREPVRAIHRHAGGAQCRAASYKTIPDEVRKYAMGHYGRLAAGLPRIHGARQHPPQDRHGAPALHISPWLPRPAELGPARATGCSRRSATRSVSRRLEAGAGVRVPTSPLTS